MFDDGFRTLSLPTLRPLAATADLVGACLYGVAVPALLVLATVPTPVRVAVVLPLLLFVPGYAITAALFPARERHATRVGDGEVRERPLGDGVSAVERFSLSVVLSVLAVAFAGVAADVLASLSLVPVMVGVAAATLLAGLVALARRVALPQDRQFAPLTAVPARSPIPSTASGALLGLGVAACVLLLAGSAMATIGPSDAEVTEFYVANETADGDLVTGDYPATFTEGEARTHHLVVEHQGTSSEGYTAVARLAPVEDGSVGDATTLDRIGLDPDENGTAIATYDVEPTDSGTYRLSYLLYEGDPPAEPSAESALRSLRVRIVVGESA